MLLKRVVTAVQALTIVVVLVAVMLLVVRQPPASPAGAAPAESAGATLFAAHCASCHGPGGGGATAPQLVGRVAQVYPNIDDQIAVVDAGKANGAMPSFKATLSGADIRSIVDFTRAPAGGTVGSSVAPSDGKAIYTDHCAACHGDFGEGTYAPAFKGGQAAQKYPNGPDETAVVLNGVGGTPMKAFGPKLTPAEIQAVVEYTRTL